MLLLHLSDIHFRKIEIDTAQDPNHHLRRELLRDVVEQCDALGAPDAIVVSGDVAFAGHPDEFAYASRWLKEVCDAFGASADAIFVCPGNHDVVREKADQNLVQLIHDKIKAAEDPNTEIARQMRDKDARRLLYESLDNYNSFALQFFCDLLPPERTRVHRDLMLSDGSRLRLWGLNTAFVSSSRDKERDLFVDPASLQIPRENGVTNVVVAHHHLSWLRQARQLEDHLNDVAPVQIFGHVHTNRIDLNVDYVRLTASAAHPDRTEPAWEPGYNLIELSVANEAGQRRLRVGAHVRVWQAAPGGFRAKMYKGRPVFETTVPLDAWSPPGPNAVAAPLAFAPAAALDEAAAQPPDGGPAMTHLRDVGLRFYRLSFSKKSEIAGRLDLLEEEDMSQPDFERFRRVFLRANARGQLDDLIAAVNAAEQA